MTAENDSVMIYILVQRFETRKQTRQDDTDTNMPKWLSVVAARLESSVVLHRETYKVQAHAKRIVFRKSILSIAPLTPLNAMYIVPMTQGHHHHRVVLFVESNARRDRVYWYRDRF